MPITYFYNSNVYDTNHLLTYVSKDLKKIIKHKFILNIVKKNSYKGVVFTYILTREWFSIGEFSKDIMFTHLQASITLNWVDREEKCSMSDNSNPNTFFLIPKGQLFPEQTIENSGRFLWSQFGSNVHEILTQGVNMYPHSRN